MTSSTDGLGILSLAGTNGAQPDVVLVDQEDAVLVDQENVSLISLRSAGLPLPYSKALQPLDGVLSNTCGEGLERWTAWDGVSRRAGL
jgi:hypothetical protein